MGDIELPRGRSLVPIEGDLEIKQREIQINEKKSVLDALKIRLIDLEEIEAKKIKFQMEVLQREIEFLNGKIITIKEGHEESNEKNNEEVN